MLLGKSLALLLLTLPAAEIAVFVGAGIYFGFLPVAIVLALTTLAGLAVLRRAGRSDLSRLRTVMGDRTVIMADVSGRQVSMLLAGILLVLPGFLTDLLGLCLLVPRLRDVLGATIRRVAGIDRAQSPDGVVDLAPADWRRVPEQQIEHESERTRLDSP